ncbi:hypothetical protein SAMN05421821_101253 [Mucilaginibacter lappiensis]|uniref:Four helix bundle sensory module for signal transduction n=1 Tax=Mucilaginibacter lappiensis TaxID=354630 RepID=A0ABR6PF17_9SPHI|nr:hypothetical protein [Mucilaginibacter lappiensis]MBB6107834.1 hypothetical protein [Mucilaginibacter lappiensis]SIP95551.1 hypothetical protein SAMN05421821_101253 [Mucilaginibacter lappiensis]
MWKRIHSNRDPRDTLYSEIHKEFNGYFSRAADMCKRLWAAYPKFFFGGMVLLLSASLILSFSVFRHSEQKKAAVVSRVNPVADGFNQILLATGNMRETIKLKKLIDSLTAKKQLSSVDSALLDSTLDRLSKIHQTLK